jgi:hypothetical protein
MVSSINSFYTIVLYIPIIFIVFAVGYTFLMRDLIQITKRKYPDKYKSLGEPNYIYNTNKTVRDLLSFVFSADSSQFPDPEFQKTRSLLRSSIVLSGFILIGLILFLLISYIYLNI